MIERRIAFVDTSAFKALVDRNDAFHRPARSIQRRLISEKWGLYSSNLVLAETHALLLARVGREPALSFIENARRSSMRILHVSDEDEVVAISILRRYQDKDFSLTDATSFLCMDRLGIREAFAFDEDFARYGFSLLA